MGGMVPKVERHKKSPKKDSSPSTFQYSQMVHVQKINCIEDRYRSIKKVAQGTRGLIFKAFDKRNSCVRAIKQITKEEGGDRSFLEVEFAILKTLDHPNITKVFEILETSKFIYIVTEFCEGEELFQSLMKAKNFPEKTARDIIFQIVSAIRHMHQHHFMHRDIKPQNIMYDSKTQVVKLVNFSSAVYFNSPDLVNRRRVGTSYYIAPEVLERCYNHKCDVWSAGVILYILLSGEPPFSGEQDIDVLKNVLKGQLSFAKPIWLKVSQPCKQLIQKMINRDISKRLSMIEIMESKWLKEHLKQREKEHVQNSVVTNVLMNMNKFKEIKGAAIQDGVIIFIMNFVSKGDSCSELMQSFKALDLNGDGMLSLHEMTVGLQRYMKITSNEAKLLAEKMFKRVDVNNSGYIDYSEFLVAAENIEVAVSQQNLDTAFDCLDVNKDAVVSVREFREKLGKNISEESYQRMIKKHDINNDGFISREEFKVMMKSLIGESSR